MSNPRYADDLARLDRIYNRNAVANRETIILVVGKGVPSELLDRPVAELLRDHIDQRGGKESPFRRAIVVTDDAWYAESQDLATKAAIAIGGPSANKLSDEFDKLSEGKYPIPGTEVLTGFFRKNSRGRPQAALWGETARGSREVVEHYLQDEKGLSEFLKMVWK
jgi:hypothetical protein